MQLKLKFKLPGTEFVKFPHTNLLIRVKMKSLFTLLLIALFVNSYAQEKNQQMFFHEIGFDYGIMASLNSAEHENYLGNKYTLHTTNYYLENFGFRTGISYINDLEGTSKFFEVPLHFVYRTKVNRDFYIGGTVETIEELLFKLVLGLMPRQGEFYGGINLGYIEPGNYMRLAPNGVDWIKEGFHTERRFVTTLDAGLRLNYKIWRFNIIGVPYVSYLLTENFKYYSESGFDQGYKPKWFMNATVGLSFQF